MTGPRIDLAGTPWRPIILSVRHEVWCLVDAADYPWLSEVTWNISWGSRTRWQLYAKRNVGPARATLRMHREIMQRADPRPPDEAAALHVDHLNGQTLDNRRANLRWCSHAQNAANRRERHLIPGLDMVVMQLMARRRRAAPQLEEVPF